MEKENLKNVLSKHLKVQPQPAFTKNVMQQIEEEAYLKLHLRASLLQEAPANFTVTVLNVINSKAVVTDYKPVISKKMWYLLMAVFAFLLYWGFNTSNSSSIALSKYTDSTLNIINKGLSVSVNYLTSHSFISLIFFSVSCLIMIDALLKSNNFKFKKA